LHILFLYKTSRYQQQVYVCYYTSFIICTYICYYRCCTMYKSIHYMLITSKVYCCTIHALQFITWLYSLSCVVIYIHWSN